MIFLGCVRWFMVGLLFFFSVVGIGVVVGFL